MATYPTWRELVQWSAPRSIAALNNGPGGRSIIPAKRGYYCFTEACEAPRPGNVIYLGIARGKRGLAQRLPAYLTTEPSVSQPIKHAGKRYLTMARLRKGQVGTEYSIENLAKNDHAIGVCWAEVELLNPGKGKERFETMFDLEYSLIQYYTPWGNSFDDEREPEFDLDDRMG